MPSLYILRNPELVGWVGLLKFSINLNGDSWDSIVARTLELTPTSSPIQIIFAEHY